MGRYLHLQEKDLLRKMLSTVATGEELLANLDLMLVEEMNDGSMGGLIFKAQNRQARNLGNTIAEAEFLDEDGVLVTAMLNLDQQNALYELDIWKVDFSPLKSWPDIETVTLKKKPETGQ